MQHHPNTILLSCFQQNIFNRLLFLFFNPAHVYQFPFHPPYFSSFANTELFSGFSPLDKHVTKFSFSRFKAHLYITWDRGNFHLPSNAKLQTCFFVQLLLILWIATLLHCYIATFIFHPMQHQTCFFVQLFLITWITPVYSNKRLLHFNFQLPSNAMQWRQEFWYYKL